MATSLREMQRSEMTKQSHWGRVVDIPASIYEMPDQVRHDVWGKDERKPGRGSVFRLKVRDKLFKGIASPPARNDAFRGRVRDIEMIASPVARNDVFRGRVWDIEEIASPCGSQGERYENGINYSL